MGCPTIRIIAVIGMMSLAGCHALHERACHKPQPYMSAKSAPLLVMPPGLDPPDTSNALRIPELNEPAPPPRTGKEPCLDEPPSFKVNKPLPPPQA